MLAILYQLADITYIGGGFNDTGIHNVLEAAVFGKPVIFSTIYEKFSEAISLIEKGGAFSVANALELESLLDKFISDEKMLKNAAYQSIKYVYANKGATNKIVQYLQANRLLTNRSNCFTV